VCMFVQNTMVHDARVRREARTLAEAGYEVTVVCLHEPRITAPQEVVHGFRILRQRRSILGISRKEIGARLRGTAPRPSPAAAPVQRSRRSVKARLASMLEGFSKALFYAPKRLMIFARFVRAGLATRADVYHAHDLNTLLMAWTASRLRRRPLIYDTHEIETGRARVRFGWWGRFLERALIRRADCVICTNRTRADYTQQRYRLSPPAILRNLPAYCEPRASDLIHDRLGLSPGTKVVLYQGGLQPDRGLEQLIEAAKEIEGGVVVILGSGRLKPALQRRVRELSLERTVLFHEAVPVDELPPWTACAYVGLQVLQNTCLNHYSSLSNKLLEYLMAGVPVIASDLPEMRRVIEDSQAGLVIDTSDAHQIAAAVNQLLSGPALREEMAERARRCRRRYCWEEEQQVLLDLYAGILTPRS
jgi:glycosyltransferase involved in cell wall biosynthesis